MSVDREDAAAAAGFLASYLVVVVVGFLTGLHAGRVNSDGRWQRQAVEQGYAEYVTDEHHRPKWQWRPTPPVRPLPE